ncbi:23S rRNA (uracil(747)-C(5))-methyltransferase RlmC [Oceanobacter mangrovi]|uniref:23S rRNA (uracil(747)-C(5))-methyltransferase RlmC n=1 Tax=Oceanobacter mangrovi TaxID=2862510 RepID=UPI001C8E8C37|nr:23S rRNA (uracil(747)-C(5))-methyltransferase RlmC [Oceanobacter mangrovi]
MSCPYFEQSLCRSCSLLNTPYDQQVEAKSRTLQALTGIPQSQWLAPCTSATEGFRNKAKMVVMGVAQAPVLGIEIETADGFQPLSLLDCQLYPQSMQTLLLDLPEWIRSSGLPPYNRHKRRGELKYLLLSQSHSSGQFMLRLVLHSEKTLERIRHNLPRLLQQHPAIAVVSANIQPVHMARLEGEQEIFLTGQQTLEESFNGIPLFMRPKGFFQTNPVIAEQLYATAARWASEGSTKHVWDLFCGSGGFALHCASFASRVTGIEIEAEAIACARLSASRLGIDNLDFDALDSAAFSQQQAAVAPDLVIVNPPRRGLGDELAQRLRELAPARIIYSSCNPATLQKDLQTLQYSVVRAQWFDMFPNTEHMEVLVELRRD